MRKVNPTDGISVSLKNDLSIILSSAPRASAAILGTGETTKNLLAKLFIYLCVQLCARVKPVSSHWASPTVRK